MEKVGDRWAKILNECEQRKQLEFEKKHLDDIAKIVALAELAVETELKSEAPANAIWVDVGDYNNLTIAESKLALKNQLNVDLYEYVDNFGQKFTNVHEAWRFEHGFTKIVKINLKPVFTCESPPVAVADHVLPSPCG